MLTVLFAVFLFFSYNVLANENVNNRIINGDEVAIEKFPYLVSIRYNDNHVCGGTILNENTIITSAQCIFDLKNKLKLISIRAGSSEHAKGIQVKASSYCVHENYEREFHENDIAIVKLASSLTWNDKIRPINLPDKDYDVPDDTAATFAGWGVATENGTQVSDTLLKTDATTISFMECTEQYGSNMIHPNMMVCAQATDREICRGDIGGPLVIHDKLVGVASWIYDCDSSAYPGVYTNVAEYRQWIDENLDKCQ